MTKPRKLRARFLGYDLLRNQWRSTRQGERPIPEETRRAIGQLVWEASQRARRSDYVLAGPAEES